MKLNAMCLITKGANEKQHSLIKVKYRPNIIAICVTRLKSRMTSPIIEIDQIQQINHREREITIWKKTSHKKRKRKHFVVSMIVLKDRLY